MFEGWNQDRLLKSVILNSLLAGGIVLVPTTVLLGIIGGRMVEADDGAVLVDISLGTILVFSSLAAVTIPFVYRNTPIRFGLRGTDLTRSGECSDSDDTREIMDCGVSADFI